MPDLTSPNLRGIDHFAFDPRTVEKPWGSELIWALTDQYAGKILFVKAGESLSLQFHNVKDEAWYVLEGRAKLEIGRAGRLVPRPGRDRRRGGLPLPARDGAPRDGRSRTRGSSRSRRRSSTTSCGSRTTTAAREPPNLNTLVVRFAAWSSRSAKRRSRRAGQPAMLRYLEDAGSSFRPGGRTATASTASAS